MRTLSFEPDDSKYELIYSLMVTGDPVRDRSQAKIHGDTCDKLEAIGQVKPAVDQQTGVERPHKRDELRFRVTVFGGDVTVEEEGYRMIVDRCTAAFPGIHVSKSRDLDRTLTWLEAIPKQEPAAVTERA